MKSCVVTENFSCDASKVWLYLTKPTLGGWRTDVTAYEQSPDGQQATEHLKDGGTVELQFTRREKPRCLQGTFRCGKVNGSFFIILLGGGDNTSVECTFEANGLGLFAKPKKLLQERLDMLKAVLG